MADFLLLNKTDLVPEEQLTALEEKMRALNPHATFFRTNHSQANLKELLDMNAFKLDQKSPDATMACAMAKRLATDTGFHVVNEALQLHGGYGYLKDYPIERYLRDLRVHQILEGTNEIMRVIIARKLLSGEWPANR